MWSSISLPKALTNTEQMPMTASVNNILESHFAVITNTRNSMKTATTIVADNKPKKTSIPRSVTSCEAFTPKTSGEYPETRENTNTAPTYPTKLTIRATIYLHGPGLSLAHAPVNAMASSNPTKNSGPAPTAMTVGNDWPSAVVTMPVEKPLATNINIDSLFIVVPA